VSGGGRSSRRDFLTSWFGAFRDASHAVSKAGSADPAKVLRPPGALAPDEDFLEACTRCGDCIPVCPVDAIITIEEDDGRKLPAINPSAKPCRLCDDLPCITACPDGALVAPEEGPSKVRIGIAKVDPRHCVTFKGELCTRCYDACPYPDKALMMIGSRPLVGSGACTGCGLCEFACPTHPKSIVIVPERDLVPGLRVPRNEYTKPGGWMG
jgi:MauM/NapG family ferredoxin protein